MRAASFKAGTMMESFKEEGSPRKRERRKDRKREGCGNVPVAVAPTEEVIAHGARKPSSRPLRLCVFAFMECHRRTSFSVQS